MGYTDDFEKECEEQVKRIAEHIEELANGNSDAIDEVEEQIDELYNNEPEEPEQEENESDEDFDKRYAEWDKAYDKWQEKINELEDKKSDLEDDTLEKYLEDYLDVDYIVNNKKEYQSCRVWITIGGPGICIDTEDSCVKLHWGSTHKEWGISYSTRDKIDAIFEQEYNF